MAEPPAAALRARSFIFAGLYLFFLSWIILFKLNLPHLGSGELRSIKLVPFIADGRYAASGMKESIVNVLLFIPVGLNLRLLLPRLRWIQAAAVGLGISALLEIAQYVLAVGSSDTTDLLTNAGGCLSASPRPSTFRRCAASAPGSASAWQFCRYCSSPRQ